MSKTMKKGISPLIATVIIIGFTIVLAAGVIYWGTDFFNTIQSQTSKGATIQNLCASDLSGLEVAATRGTNTIAVTIDNTKNNVDLYGLVLTIKNGPTSVRAITYTGAGVLTPGTTPTAPGTVSVGRFNTANINLDTVTDTNLGTLGVQPALDVAAGGALSSANTKTVSIRPFVKASPGDANEVPSVCGNEIETTVIG